MSHALEMSVRNGPAMMQLTRTFGPSAFANPSVIALSAALAAAYGRYSGCGRIAPTDEMFTIDPPSPSAMRSPISAVRRNGPLKFTATTLSNSPSSSPERLGYSGDSPALSDEHVHAAELRVG